MQSPIRWFGVFAVLVVCPAVRAQTSDEAALNFFEKKVRPLFVDNCYNCHSASNKASGGLRVDDRNGLIQGGKSGPGIVPGHPEQSVVLERIAHGDAKKRMPPNKQLTEEQIADLTQWIKAGAAWPEPKLPSSVGKYAAKYEQLRKEHWAWQPLTNPALPRVDDAAWSRDELDRFVLAKLEEKRLRPVGDADRFVLIRRVTFDLTGLPPTPEEVDAFLQDTSATAFERVVDRLLQSPAYGERWGRHWLDIARYGESTGSSRNVPYPHAWRYRDYVIDAFARDVPYDQFVREQIAGDLLPARTQEERDRQAVATGFLALGVRDVNQRFKVRFTMDTIDEAIDTVSRSVLALTASCARCHDHKFDPIPTADYYGLAGIFQSSDLCAGVRSKMGGGGLDYYDPSMLLRLGTQRQVDPKLQGKIDELTKAVAKARADFEALRDSPEGNTPAPNGKPKKQMARQKMNRLQKELLAINDPSALGDLALGAREGKQIGDTQIRIRGEAEKLGPTVPRGFLSAVRVPDAPKIGAGQSGRLELAHWLSSPKNPLTSRVMVNRVWKHLFDSGLVTSVDNFGVTGDRPSHPELLDHLAGRFIADGWSVKRLIRTIVLSRTYQLGSEATPTHVGADPANRLLWRHNPRRLDAEEIRDTMLAAAGQLNRQRPNGSIAKDLKVVEMRNNGPEARDIEESARRNLHRSVYLPLLRGITPKSLEVFDFAEQGLVTGSRDTTTVAPQALYLLNDPFVRRQALALAERLLAASKGDDDAARIHLAYRLTLARTPTSAEVARSRKYLAVFEKEAASSVGKTGGAKQQAAPRGKTAQPDNPDLIDQTDEPVREEIVQASDARTAAWATFCQALLGSAEFRYLR